MKRIFLSATLMLLAAASFAQSDRFAAGMQKAFTLLDSVKTTADYTNTAAAFERIGDAEKTQWLPYYYAAFCNIMIGFNDEKVDKDQTANKAEAILAKAEALEPKNSEIFVLKNMANTLHMIVDPMTRWQQYGAKGTEYLATALQIDPNNPRAYLMQGQGVFGMPVQFGGGKDKAKPLFEKSVALYNTQKPAPMAPRWGKSLAESMLAACNK